MRRFLIPLIVLTVGVLATTAAFADCAAGALWSFPKNDAVVPANASVLIVAYGNSQEQLKKSVKSTVFFEAGKERISAKVNLLRGEFQQTVAQLNASKPLKPGLTYSVNIAGETFKWKVGAMDKIAPKWSGEPVFKKFDVIHFGCGPAKTFELSGIAADANGIYYDVILDDGKKKQRFYDPQNPNATMIGIGHGMCSGEFSIAPKTQYTLTITPVDLGGNRGRTKVLKVKSN